MTTADDNGNGRATIREVHELLALTRREVLDALGLVARDMERGRERIEARISKVETEIARFDERFTLHEELDGHPGVIKTVNHQGTVLARYAAVLMAIGVMVNLGVPVLLRLI